MFGQQQCSVSDTMRDEIQKAAQAAEELLRAARTEMHRHPVSAGMMVNDAISQLERILTLTGAPAPTPDLRPWQRPQRLS